MRKLVLKIATMTMMAMFLLPTSYVSAADNTPAIIEDFDVMTTKKTMSYITINVAPVRSGPSKNFKIIDSLPKGRIIYAEEVNSEWVKFDLKGVAAYVSKQYLSAIK